MKRSAIGILIVIQLILFAVSLSGAYGRAQIDNADTSVVSRYEAEKVRYLRLGREMQWEEALAIALACEATFVGKLPPKSEADLIYNIGYIYDKSEQYQLALDYFHRSIALYEAIHDVDSLDLRNDLALAYNNIGVTHANTGFFTQRKASYLKAKEIWESMGDEVDKNNLISLYGNLLRLFSQYGDKRAAGELISTVNEHFDRWVAEEAFGKGKKGVDRQKPRALYHVDKHRLNILYTDLTDNKSGGLAHLDSLRMHFNRMDYRDQKQYSSYLLSAINGAAAPLVDYDDPKERQLKKRYLDLGMRESIRLGDRYNEMIFHTQWVNFYLFSADDYEKALTHLDKALQIGREMDIREFNLLNIYLKRGDVLQQTGRFEEAEQMAYHGFSLLLGEPVTDLYTVQREAFAQRNDLFYINALREVAKIYKNQYEKAGDPEHAELAHHFYVIAADLFHTYYQKGVYNPWLDMSNADINEGLLSMHIGLARTDHSELINTMENNASQHLWKEFEAKYQQYSRVPDSLLLQRNRLLAQVGQTDTAQTLQDELESVQLQIHTIDPTYAPFFEASFDVTVLQHQLQPDQLVLKYEVTNAGVYAFSIGADAISVTALGHKDTLLQQVQAYYEVLKAVQADYRAPSEDLYRLLVEPLQIQTAAINTLIIIPENILSFLPFETLINPDSGKPLIYHYHISYSHSLKLWHLQQQPVADGSQKVSLAAFSPSYSDHYLASLADNDGVYRERLQDIEGAAQEAEYVTRAWEGDLYRQARKQDFLDNTAQYQVYHFAMHALLDEADHRNSSLLFQDEEPLFYDELYGLHFPAELVVLSACNTGVGKLEKGEGLMSLSRALTYSGVRSSVYSLWQVPDEETAEIMTGFYAHLKTGQTKAEALANAKRDFLTNNPMKSHPFFWAGFVVNGHIGSLPSSGFPYWIVGLVAVIVMLAVIVIVVIGRKAFS
ncbi:CHAT domain-containing protein [Parapedobacter deserti]|uniref:CHAT domain-containing protein n=1 Tax=Parapedobacter deserti TaxID=1912957 RepID=A0ABV7JFP9_9SPHI